MYRLASFAVVLFLGHAVFHILFPAIDAIGHVVSIAAAAWSTRNA